MASHNVTKQIVATANDVFVGGLSSMGSGGTLYATSSWIGLGNNNASDKFASCYRFLHFNIPHDATITSAYLIFTSESNRGNDTVKLRIYGDNTQLPVAPTNRTTFWAKTRTTAYVDWEFTTDWTTDGAFNSADISSIIQELVNDYGGCDLIQLIIWDNGSDTGAWRTTYDYTGSSAKSVQLYVEYTVDYAQKIGSVAWDGNNTGGNADQRILKLGTAITNDPIIGCYVYANTNLADFTIGTFSGSGTTYTNRDYEVIGAIAAGAVRTITGLNIDCQIGDLLGWNESSGAVERTDLSGDTTYGIYHKSGAQWGTGSQSYTLYNGETYSIMAFGGVAMGNVYDIASRFYLSPPYIDIATRFDLDEPFFKDIATRFYLSVPSGGVATSVTSKMVAAGLL